MRHFRTVLSFFLMVSPISVRGQDTTRSRESGSGQHPNVRPEVCLCGAAAPRMHLISVGGSITQKSKLRSSVQPVYPSGSKGVGKIILGVTINEDGLVYSIRFLRCPAMLKQAVRAAICQWRYEPTYLQIDFQTKAVPMLVVVELSYNFARYRM